MAIAHSMASDAPSPGVVFRPADRSAGLPCWLAMPEHVADDEPPLVAVHGIRRNAFQQAELFARRANALGRPVIAPLFDRRAWPRYQQAVRRGRADLAMISLMERLREQGIWRAARFELFGFSGGAQFAHRFAMMHPEMVVRLTVASAGWYTFPDAAPFPRGLSARTDPPDPWAAVTEERLMRFLEIPTRVCVGADDTGLDRNLRRDKRIDARQGENRLIRGVRWTKALRRAADARGMPARASFVALSACGHDFRQCVLRGGLDRIVIPGIDRPRPAAGGGRDCATCDRPCRSEIRFLRPVP